MTPRPFRGMTGGAAALVAAGAVAGGVLVGTLGANAADSTDTTTTTTTAPPYAGPGGPPSGAQGATPVRPDETTPSDDIVATLTKKAEAEVPGGTVIRVETDAGDAAYEAHMTKADGSMVTVKFDKDLNVKEVEDGMGLGDPRPAGGPMGGGPPPPPTQTG